MLNFRSLSKQAQQLQEKLGSIQEELSNRRVDASSGGGMVKVVCDGLQNVVAVKIDPSVVDPEDVEMLEDLVVAAVNEGRKAAQKLQEEEFGKLTGGLKIPGLF